jgi:MYXO-CTERM domain-containing protein
MRIFPLLVLGAVSTASLLVADQASACGGCFTNPNAIESTQVTGHRMVLSITPEATTLWDQITYAGNPSEFAWVLPTKGVVEIGLSSDALFATLEGASSKQLQAPTNPCPPPPFCNGGATGTGMSAASSTGAGGGVDVIASAVVGPYETVQLSADDPDALALWLDEHGYGVPADVQPVIDGYVADGFNFLALKLVPGQGIDAMKPVRVTTPGASIALPLRMVAAGVGTTAPIALWVLGEGRYEPTNFPSFVIDASEVSWDWASSSSDYRAVREAHFLETAGKSWSIETAEPTSRYGMETSLLNLASYAPLASGYGDESGEGAVEACQADLDKLFGTLDATSLWLTQMYAELPRTALTQDLVLGAAASQSTVPRLLQITKQTGAPVCQIYDACDGDGWAFGSGVGGSSGIAQSGGGSGCAMGGEGGAPLGAVIAALGIAVAVQVRRRRR